MKVILRLEVTEDTQRRVRAELDRGGKATRSELQNWLQRQIERGLGELPEPKTRGRKDAAPFEDPNFGKPTTPAEVVDEGQADGIASRRLAVVGRFEAARSAAESAICSHCGRAKADHGKVGFTCPPVIGKPRGRMFEAVAL